MHICLYGNPENDIRQPLFAVFSMPFIGVGYITSQLFSFRYSSQIFMHLIQIVLFVVTNIILAKMLKLNSLKRMFFVLLISSTYASILFSVMMEQYIIAYFYLILTLYSIYENKQDDTILLIGASNTLITSCILAPIFYEKFSFANIKNWLKKMFQLGTIFILLLIFFGKADVLLYTKKNMNSISRFNGEGILFENRVNQYTEFLDNYFTKPEAEMIEVDSAMTWQLKTIEKINWVGVAIIALSIISYLLNRQDKFIGFSMFFAVYSFIVLCLFGYGTAENGLILYSLYFGWPFFILIFKLIENICDLFKNKYILPVVCGTTSLMLIFINFSGITEMANELAKYYPW